MRQGSHSLELRRGRDGDDALQEVPAIEKSNSNSRDARPVY